MQYPIIDLITDAYINNGWTGLDISTGKNLINIPDADNLVNSGVLNTLYNPIFVDGKPNTQYTFSCDYISPISSNSKWGIIISYTDNTSQYGFIMDNGNIIPSITSRQNKTISKIDFVYTTTIFDVTIHNFMLEKGATATPFEPYSEPKNDFPNRLKLPLPHYFPHPVIDALQRAAAGTQTTDDTEILRHYLTPLGIGGI